MDGLILANLVRGLRVPTLRGKVVSGLGNFSFWIEKLHDHYLRKTGMHLFAGTLNIELQQPWTVPEGSLQLEGAEYGGTVTVNIVPCSVFGRPARYFERWPMKKGADITPEQ